MTVKFVRFSLPNGKRDTVEFSLEPEIEQMAHDLQNEGVIFDIETLMTGVISMTAGFDDSDEPLAHELCFTRPNIKAVITNLVTKARATWED